MFKYIELLEKSGFVLWENEEWGPGPNQIDWASNYENELKKFFELTVEACAQQVDHIQVWGTETLGDGIRKKMFDE